ncbi:MAG: MerR family transcriptional regulator [Gemmatimonadetes bacterium]|nr:MerR family transcriptional regulator [Gemmatimonadota bacterium]
MTAGTVPSALSDPLLVLREYRQLAPWSLRDLAAVSAAILDASAIRPINAAASAHPNERTIRFYVTRGLVAAPEGRGTAAIYSYRHLLQVLAIKLRQMEGGTLAAISREMVELTGDVLERRVAATLGPSLPSPDRLPLTGQEAPPRGRVARALRSWRPQVDAPTDPDPVGVTAWQRIPVARGLEVHINDAHPLARRAGRSAEIADAIRAAVSRLLAAD